MTGTYRWSMLLALLAFGQNSFSQAARPAGTLVVDGSPGQADTMTVNGRLYVNVDALARLLGASTNQRGDQTILFLKDSQPSVEKLSSSFVVAGIQLMSSIREWRHEVVYSVANVLPDLESVVGSARRDAETKLALASAAAITDGDRDALVLLNNASTMIHQFSDKYLELNRNLVAVSARDVEQNELGQQILACGKGLERLASTLQYQDVESCH